MLFTKNRFAVFLLEIDPWESLEVNIHIFIILQTFSRYSED